MKEEEKRKSIENNLVFAGQLEVNSVALSSKHSTLPSKHSTIRSKQSTLPSQNKNTQMMNDEESGDENVESMNILFLQTSSGAKLIKFIQNIEFLSENKGNPTKTINRNFEYLVNKNYRLQHQDDDDGSPIFLRKLPRKLFSREEENVIRTEPGSDEAKNLSASESFEDKKLRSRLLSDTFYSLESNINSDQQSQLCVASPALCRDANLMKTSQTFPTISSLPSVLSGFVSADSSFRSRTSSHMQLAAGGEASPASQHEHVEPVVRVEHHEHDNFQNTLLKKKKEDFLDRVKNTKSLDRGRRVTITSLADNQDRLALKKSLSMSSTYGNVTVVQSSSLELPLNQSHGLQHQAAALKRISTFRRYARLGLKQLGSRVAEVVAGQRVRQEVYEEGELAGWTAKDIYEIVSKDLPVMDLVVLVVDQQEKRRLEQSLSCTTGVLGYIRDYWAGFFPLLLVEVQDSAGESEPLDPRARTLLASLFSVTHRVLVPGLEHAPSAEFVFETCARFQAHCRSLHCERWQAALHTAQLGRLVSLGLTQPHWVCTGLCGMRTQARRQPPDPAARPVGLLRSVRNTIVHRAATSHQ